MLYSCIYVYPRKQCNSDVSAHSLELCETALIDCLIMLIIYVCGIVVLIKLCVCSIARIGCYIGPNGPNATILEY